MRRDVVALFSEFFRHAFEYDYPFSCPRFTLGRQVDERCHALIIIDSLK